jgi:hypothetical protein
MKKLIFSLALLCAMSSTIFAMPGEEKAATTNPVMSFLKNYGPVSFSTAAGGFIAKSIISTRIGDTHPSAGDRNFAVGIISGACVGYLYQTKGSSFAADLKNNAATIVTGLAGGAAIGYLLAKNDLSNLTTTHLTNRMAEGSFYGALAVLTAPKLFNQVRSLFPVKTSTVE